MRKVLATMVTAGVAVALVLTGQTASQATSAHLVKVSGSSSAGYALTWSSGKVEHRLPLKREMRHACKRAHHKRACRAAVRADYRGLARTRDALAAKDRQLAVADAVKVHQDAEVALMRQYHHTGDLNFFPTPDNRPASMALLPVYNWTEPVCDSYTPVFVDYYAGTVLVCK